MLGTLLIVLLVLLLLGGLAPWPGPVAPGGPRYQGYGYGWPVGGVLGLILVIAVILALLGSI